MLGYCFCSCCEKAEVLFPVQLPCRLSSAIHPSGICKRVVGVVINHLSLNCLERADDRSALHSVMPPDTTGIFCFILIKWIICRLLQKKKMTIHFYFYFFFQNWFYSCYVFPRGSNNMAIFDCQFLSLFPLSVIDFWIYSLFVRLSQLVNVVLYCRPSLLLCVVSHVLVNDHGFPQALKYVALNHVSFYYSSLIFSAINLRMLMKLVASILTSVCP